LVAPALRVTLVIALCAAFTTPAAAQGLLDFFRSLLPAFVLPAQTLERARTKTKQGYGAKVHGKVKINDKDFHFVSGGRGRGSAPFGTYQIGPLSGFMTPRGTLIPGYQLSDAYDPFVNDTRTGLFIHPGHNASSGCVAIRKNEWPSFVKAMERAVQVGRPLAIHLGPESEPMEKPVG
jgi:hypothetical protein